MALTRHWRRSHDMIQSLALSWHDPSCNTARYYVLSIEPSLFGETTLTDNWSHISWPGQTRIALYENHTVAMAALEACSSASAVVATS